MTLPTTGWTLTEWQNAYKQKTISPRETLDNLISSLDPADPAWIHIASKAQLEEQLNHLPPAHPDIPGHLPLYGIPFVVKDNIDVAGWETSAACPAYCYTSLSDAPTVAHLKAAGAIVIAKTNLDQFATGLVGVRSPYGIPENPFSSRHIPGGSSSGSAVAISRGIVPFSLGTDTAGSGRVPAGFNNIVGWKPTRGSASSRGVVPACRTLDCVSIFALNVSDARTIATLIERFDPQDPYARKNPGTVCHPEKAWHFAVPDNPEWFGDSTAEQAWYRALERLTAMGTRIEAIDFSPMRQLAALLYGPWVAERTAGVGDFVAQHRKEVHPVVADIILQGKSYTAAEFCQTEYQRAELSRAVQAITARYTALLVPTAPRFPTINEVLADPVRINSQLGTWTNFVNLADCCALALPGPLRSDGLPAGITLIAPAWHDQQLANFGMCWEQGLQSPLGATGRTRAPASLPSAIHSDPERIAVAVVGAHLSGMPLNHQLTTRKAILLTATTTSAHYRLYALPDTTPPKPGLFRCTDGAEIAIEVWSVPIHLFGSFVAAIPPPLAMGSVELADGTWCKGFVCEPHAIADKALDITHHGGWKAWLSATTPDSTETPKHV